MSTKNFLLTAGNLPGYLVSRGLARDEREVAVRELGGGISNIVLLVEWGGQALPAGRRWVVKQSLEKLRVKDDWRSERARIFREAEAIHALGRWLHDSLPEVVHIDRENFLYLMTAAPAGSEVWKEMLLGGGRGNLEIARQAGWLLARFIDTSRSTRQFENSYFDRAVFDQLRLDPYYRTAAARHPDVQLAYGELIADSLKTQTALVHGDYSPKNMLVRDGKIFLIDFEVVHWGDPSFDSAFLLNHLFLKAFHQPRLGEIYFDAAREFWRTLGAGLGLEGWEDFEAMTVRHLGGLMLARIDGKSPVEYIRDEGTKARVRRVAKGILRDRPHRLKEVIQANQRNLEPG